MRALRFDGKLLVFLVDKGELGERIRIFWQAVLLQFRHIGHVEKFAFVDG